MPCSHFSSSTNSHSFLQDPSINRLEDFFLLWRSICSSKLLAKTTMIVFLNKCDILKRKLEAGALVKEQLPSLGDRSHDGHSVVKCKCSLPLSKMAVFI